MKCRSRPETGQDQEPGMNQSQTTTVLSISTTTSTQKLQPHCSWGARSCTHSQNRDRPSFPDILQLKRTRWTEGGKGKKKMDLSKVR